VSGPFDLSGKVAVITGSSRGIGRAIALRMAEAGARVVVSSRKQAACDVVVAEIEQAHGPGRALAVAASLSSRDDLKALVARTEAAFGRIDILVCNAASNPYAGPMSGISDEQFRKVLDNNVLANHWLIQFALPALERDGGGAVVIVSSIGGLQGSPVLGAYNISKAADMQLARNLAVELGPRGIRVNCIAPGLVRTDFARALWEDPATLAHYTEGTPLGRIAEPDEIAGCAVFLASPAASFVTGHTLVADGGVTIAGA